MVHLQKRAPRTPAGQRSDVPPLFKSLAEANVARRAIPRAGFYVAVGGPPSSSCWSRRAAGRSWGLRVTRRRRCRSLARPREPPRIQPSGSHGRAEVARLDAPKLGSLTGLDETASMGGRCAQVGRDVIAGLVVGPSGRELAARMVFGLEWGNNEGQDSTARNERIGGRHFGPNDRGRVVIGTLDAWAHRRVWSAKPSGDGQLGPFLSSPLFRPLQLQRRPPGIRRRPQRSEHDLPQRDPCPS